LDKRRAGRLSLAEFRTPLRLKAKHISRQLIIVRAVFDGKKIVDLAAFLKDLSSLRAGMIVALFHRRRVRNEPEA